jgi:hypothetical protein
MGLESGATYPVGLNSAWPLDTDTRREGAAHIRETKLCLKNYSKLLDGAGASKSILEHIYPVGSIYTGVPNSNSNPDNDIGGTWVALGVVAIDSNNSAHLPGVGAPILTELWSWIRTA